MITLKTLVFQPNQTRQWKKLPTTMKKAIYTDEFREQALSKVYARKNSTIDEVAQALNMQPGTLKSWMRAAVRANKIVLPVVTKNASEWTAAERLLALHETHSLDELALAAWCRERGLFAHQLTQWKNDFCTKNSSPSVHESQQEIRALKQKNQQLQNNVARKDKALAEAAALLVLQKKFQALWEGEDA